jgi:hypothetical protein
MSTPPSPQSPVLPAAAGAVRTPSRSFRLALLAVAALLALVYLLPTREDGASRPVQDRLRTVAITLDEPPEWARQRGHDEITRCLDRLSWGSHAAATAARAVLSRHAGQLAPELLSRLAALGSSDPVMASKLVELLGAEDPTEPGVLDELAARALSFNGLEARAALRVLSRINHPRSVNAVHTRLFDQDPDIVGFARGALAELARRGSPEAREIVLDELEADPLDVDMAYLTVAAAMPRDDRTDSVLQRIADQGQGTVRLVALTGLLVRDDPQAEAIFEEFIATGSGDQRLQALRAAGSANRVLAQGQWEFLIQQDVYPLSAALMRVLFSAIDSGHPDAARAMDLLEKIAVDPTMSVQTLVLDALFVRRHPNVIEGVRADLQVVEGMSLALTVDRILGGPTDRPSDLALRAELAQLALKRLETGPELRDGDRVVLCRLVATIAPDESAPLLVDYALGRRGVDRVVSEAVTDLLGPLGDAGLRRLQAELGTPEADALAVYAASAVRSEAALPLLEQLLVAEGTRPDTRRAALDCLGLVQAGPREEVLRRVLDRVPDPALRERAQLVFWNYL